MKQVLYSLILLSAFSAPSAVKSADPLPGTQPLTDTGDLAAKMVAGMHKYLDRELAAAPRERQNRWKIDRSSEEAYAKSAAPHRERLKKYLGVVDARVPPRLEYTFGPGESSRVADAVGCKIDSVRWAVLPGVDAEGYLIEPRTKVVANVVAIPHADQTPEEITLGGNVPFALDLARHGCRVLVPTLIDRKDTFSGNPKLNRATNLPHREFVYRMAYEMGRTLPGYEVQKVLAAVDWFAATSGKLPVGVIGYGDGGMIALYAAALDERIKACGVSAFFAPREGMAEEPIDRNVWGRVRDFGDAELGLLVTPHLLGENDAPRKLTLDPAPTTKFDPKFFPAWPGPVAAKPGRGGAAPGTLGAPSYEAVNRESDRMYWLVDIGVGWPMKQKPGNHVETGWFLHELTGAEHENLAWAAIQDPDRKIDPAARQKRQFDQLVAFTQKLWRDSDATRNEFWKKADASSPEAWEKSCEWYRDYFHNEVIGKLPEPTIPLNPRTRQVYDEKTWTGYEVMLDVYPDVFAYGILLLPKDLKPGERRPVVVCQHGLEGTPRHTIDVEKRTVYNHFSRRLVEQGYIVYAPQNPYYGENIFRQLQRKANPLKLSLFSFIIRQHQRTLDWLETLPNVDPKRIAFYGLSYGGKTAMRVPAVEKRYCLSICSGDFNEWVGKNVSVDLDRSYMWTREYEMYEFDLGNTFNYAEMAYLIAPRPFMVERGHDDPVGTDEMVAYEYAKVRYLYANRLKIGDRTEIEFFPGGHMINGKGTLAFLAKHLKWEPR
jgi:dienelactone hydrolase